MGADDYVTGRDFDRMAPRVMEQYMAPALANVVEMTAQGNLAHVQRDSSAIFQKYGPEVLAKLAGVPKNLWTVDNLKTVVNLVKADHVEELAREQATRLVAEMEPTWRSTGAAAAPGAFAQPTLGITSETLPSDWRARAGKAGLTEQALDEFCRANEITREDWFKMFDKTAITEVRRG